MNQCMGRRYQIGLFARFKAHRSLKCLQICDPYVYHVVYQGNMRVSFDLLLCFTVGNGGSQQTEIIGNTRRIQSHKRGVLKYY